VPAYELKGIGPPHPKQQEAIDLLLTPSEKVRLVDVCAGRGWGKSEFAILVAFMMLMMYKGICGLFLEPDWSRVNKVFLRKWKRMIPSALYTLNKSERCITMINGSVLYYQARNVTGNKDAADDAGRGPDVAFIVDDEAAIKCSAEMYVNNMAAIREPCKSPFYLTISTFQYGDYERLLDDPSHIEIIGRTKDNIYLPAGYEAGLRAVMPPEVAARELDSERGIPEGQIWSHFKFEPWPKGNILDGYEFVHGEPWYLGIDLGNHASYQIYQTPPPFHPLTGQKIMEGRLLCATEEWLVNNDVNRHGHGGLEGILDEIILTYCGGNPNNNPPEFVYLGHDANTKGAIVAQSAVGILNKLGWNWSFPGGALSSKDVQRSHLVNMIWERRYVVAGKKNSRDQWEISKQYFGEGKKRGILEVMKRDVRPKDRGGVFIKDKKSSNPKSSLEDDRDAALYTAVKWRHPDTYDAAYFLRRNNTENQ